MRMTRKRDSAGFSLLEAMVALLLLSLIMVSFLAMLDTFSSLVKVQSNVADTTENMRFTMAALIRQVRMAGTGGLPVVFDPGGGLVPLAVDVDDSVAAGATFTSSVSTNGFGVIANRAAVAGTDAIRIRGVISNPIFDIIAGNFPDANTVNVPETSPWTENLQALQYPVPSDGRAFLVSQQSPLDITPSIGGIRQYASYRIVTTTSTGSITEVGPGTDYLTVDFDDGNSAGYAALNPGGLTTVMTAQAYTAGYLDDIIYYIALNDFGEPSLYRLRVTSSGAGTLTAEELVPNVSNFQVALGCDINRDGQLQATEWYLDGTNGAPSADQFAALSVVRLSVVSRTQDPDRKWTSTATMPENAPALSGDDLEYRYRVVTVRVALRSHPRLI